MIQDGLQEDVKKSGEFVFSRLKSGSGRAKRGLKVGRGCSKRGATVQSRLPLDSASASTSAAQKFLQIMKHPPNPRQQ